MYDVQCLTNISTDKTSEHNQKGSSGVFVQDID